MTLDTDTGAVVARTELPGFLRLSDAGDGRHVMVTDGDVFRVFDTGLSTVQHGDHAHHYASPPAMTPVTYAAPHAGHVVVHEGTTTLFADGSGEVTVVESNQIATAGAPRTTYTTRAPHHGVAVPVGSGALLTTQGTEKERRTVQVVKADSVVAETNDCPGVHGEATARPTATGAVVAVGCTDGPVVWRDGAFQKLRVPGPDGTPLPYSRVGNMAGSEASPYVLGDLKVDQTQKVERTTTVVVVGTLDGSVRPVRLPASYWFRSLGRGPVGEGLVLTYDGALQVIDMQTAALTASIPVISPWQEKGDWQLAGPSLKVLGTTAYVTDVNRKEVVLVDLTTYQVAKRIPLPDEPVEIAVTDGRSPR